jgi:hypothetical protein
MKLILEVISGPDAPRSFVIEPGMEVRVGRAAPAEIVLSNDRTVSRIHFGIKHDGQTIRIKDLGSTHGTTVNGVPLTGGVLTDGDLIIAGSTALRVKISERAGPAVAPAEGGSGWPAEALPTEVGGVVAETGERAVLGEDASLHDRVLEVLRAQPAPLFAILDAARDPLVYLRITECPEPKQSLYEGPEAVRLSFVAPYLISLPKDSPFLEKLVREGWGKAWGVYLTCDRPFDEVRRHLRHFLMVEVEGKRQKMVFRFYDPRVLRTFLPTCTSEEIAEFFGPLDRILLESADPNKMLEFGRKQGGLSATTHTAAVVSTPVHKA